MFQPNDRTRRALLAGALTPLFALALAGSSPRAALAASTGVFVETATGTLNGTLETPDGAPGSVPVVLIVAGSGPTNRDGSNAGGVSVTPYRQLAGALAARGIASVRYDKRGVAGSALSAKVGDQPAFTTYVDDVAAWVTKLRADRRFSRVVVVGHSEGSLLALLAAAEVPVDGIVSLEGAGRPALDVIVEQMTAASTPPDEVAAAKTIASEIRDGKDPGAVPSDLQPLFPHYLRTYEQQWFSTDPTAASRAVAATPLLVVQGGKDIQVSEVDGQRIAAAHPGASYRMFPSMNHVLLDVAGNDRAANLAAYNDTSLAIDPLMVDTVAAFVLQQRLPGNPR